MSSISEATDRVIPLQKPQQERPLCILAVDDDRLERAFLEEQLRDLGHQTILAGNGQEALELLRKHKDKIDVVLMDWMMPIMDGLSVVRKMKENFELRRVPVVMLSGVAGQSDIEDGLAAGVFYYLTKPAEESVLRSILTAAGREARHNQTLRDELKKHHTSFHLIHVCKFKYRTLDEAEALAAFMARCFPDPERVLSGLAELLVNAVEHGNLEIGYDAKTELLDSGLWHTEILRRQELPEYKDRIIEASIARRDDGIYAVVTDQGNGFDWAKYMTIDPSRAGDNHGRGIAQAKAVSFDKLTYNAKGNQAVAFVGNKPQLEW